MEARALHPPKKVGRTAPDAANFDFPPFFFTQPGPRPSLASTTSSGNPHAALRMACVRGPGASNARIFVSTWLRQEKIGPIPRPSCLTRRNAGPKAGVPVARRDFHIEFVFCLVVLGSLSGNIMADEDFTWRLAVFPKPASGLRDNRAAGIYPGRRAGYFTVRSHPRPGCLHARACFYLRPVLALPVRPGEAAPKRVVVKQRAPH